MHKENQINIQCIRRQPVLGKKINPERKTVYRGREVRGGLAEKVREGAMQYLGGRHSRCKGPAVGMHSAYSRRRPV